VLSAVVGGVTRDHRARCSFEAKVSIERIGPSGTFAGHRPDSSGDEIAVALTALGTRWAAGSINSLGGARADFQRLPSGRKSVPFGRRKR
jgi:hypothetical protein